jgi:phage/plasmid-associated DNA primase
MLNDVELKAFRYLNNYTDEQCTELIAVGCPLTDIGNAERLILYHGNTIRYCAERKSWFIWRDIRWEPDVTGEINELAKETVIKIYQETRYAADETERKAIGKFALQSESQKSLRDMVACAKTDPRVAITESQFDANRWLINCPNGTIDLKERVFKPHDRNDLLTMCARVPYVPNPSSQLFIATLFAALPLEQALYCQRLFGSFLEYTTQNKEWLYVYGMAFAMKSSVTQAVYASLGDYAKDFDISLLTKQKHNIAPNAARPEIIALEGVRIAWTEEAEPNFVIDDATLKSLTSSGVKSARQVYEKQRKVQLGCSFVVESNGTFTFDMDDEWSREAALERTAVMKFVNALPKEKRDKQVLKKLTNDEAELTVALAWAVQGYFDQLDDGNEKPESITAASEEFEAVINPLNLFVKRDLVFDDGRTIEGKDYAEVSVKLTSLYERFQETADADTLKMFKGERSFNRKFKDIATYYAERSGVEISSEHRRDGIYWSNVRLKDPEEFEVEHFAIKTQKEEPKGSCDDVTIEPYFAKDIYNLEEYYSTLQKNDALRHNPIFPKCLTLVEASFSNNEAQNSEHESVTIGNELKHDLDEIVDEVEDYGR